VEIVYNLLNMGQIFYITIKDSKCCGGNPTTFEIPEGATPHEIATITGSSIDIAIELWETRIQNNNNLCPTIYYNTQIQQVFTKNNCAEGIGSNVTFTVPANTFSSQLSQKDADDKALAFLNKEGQKFANLTGTCIPINCINCNQFRVTKTSSCGEYRINTECRNGRCTDISSEYFVCNENANCKGEVCVEDCINCSTTCTNGTCPPNFNCISGVCVPDCNNADCSINCLSGNCPEGKQCINGRCQDIRQFDCVTCSTVCPNGVCPDNFICSAGSCIPQCVKVEGENVIVQPCSINCLQGTCPSGQECRNGKCENIRCASYQTLVGNNCVDKPCDPPCEPAIETFECFEKVNPTKCFRGNCIQTIANDSTINPIREGEPCDNNSGKCISGNCEKGCPEGCPQNEFTTVTNSGGCLQSRNRVSCITGNCVETSTIETRLTANGTACITSASTSGTCQSGQCLEDCAKLNETSSDVKPCCAGLFKRPSDGLCLNPIDVDTKVYVYFDTTSFSANERKRITDDILTPFFEEFEQSVTNWVGYEIIEDGTEDWLNWGVHDYQHTLNAPIGYGLYNNSTPKAKKSIVICFIDESEGFPEGFAFPSPKTINEYHGQCGGINCSNQFDTQPTTRFKEHYMKFADSFINYYTKFTGIVYAIPAGNQPATTYAALHYNVYGSVEGDATLSKGAEFIDSFQSSIIDLKQKNPYSQASLPNATTMQPLKQLGWREKHDFQNGANSLTLAQFREDVLNLLLQ
jgi:hypothetical protein